MAVETVYGRMFCTTSDAPFGPQFDDDNQCEEFIRWVRKVKGGDPRAFILDDKLDEFKAEFDGTKERWDAMAVAYRAHLKDQADD